MATATREDDKVVASFSVNSSGDIRFIAEDIRRERTGVHAVITIAFNSTLLASDEFNVRRDPEHVRLVNSALGMLPKKTVEKAILKHEFDIFCRNIWSTYLAGIQPEELPGDAVRTAPAFLLEPYILRTAGTIVYGPPERGKSFTGMLWTQALNNDISSDFWPLKKTRTLFLNLERSRESISRRLHGVNLALGLPVSTPLLSYNARGKGLTDIYDGLKASVSKYDIKCVVIDSISRSGQGDLKEDETANRIISMFNGLNISWVALAHTPRGDDSHIFGCHDDKTEVLTRRGWVTFANWHEGESVLSWQHNNGYSHFEFATPEQFHCYPYVGDLIHISTPSIEGLVTPGHRFFIHDKQDKKRWVEANDLPSEFRLPFSRTIKAPSHSITEKMGIPLDDLSRFIGIFVSEGSIVPGYVMLSQSSTRKDYIQNTLNSLGFEHRLYEYEPQREKDTERMAYFQVREPKPRFFRWLRANCGVGAASKHLPTGFLRWPLGSLQTLFEALMWGDGHWNTKRYGVYTTISRQLADDVQMLAMRLGYGARVSLNTNRAHTVQIWEGRRWRWIRRNAHVERVPYDGNVYCFTMPAGTLVTRRNGKILVSGNSHMFEAGADLMVMQLSQQAGNTLGVGFRITKKNDIRPYPLLVLAYEFDPVYGFQGLRRANPGEFIDIETAVATSGGSTEERIYAYIESEGEATAGQVAAALGMGSSGRMYVSRIMAKSSRFAKTRRTRQGQFYGCQKKGF